MTMAMTMVMTMTMTLVFVEPAGKVPPSDIFIYNFFPSCQNLAELLVLLIGKDLTHFDIVTEKI